MLKARSRAINPKTYYNGRLGPKPQPFYTSVSKHGLSKYTVFSQIIMVNDLIYLASRVIYIHTASNPAESQIGGSRNVERRNP